MKFHGKEKADTLNQAKKGRVDIVLTTFETTREYLDDLNRVSWQMVVVDECHKIKENNSAITQTLKSLKCLKRIGLTGTALQNKYEELWCVLDWANPGCLGSLELFKRDFSRPMVRGFRQDATTNELSTARKKQNEFNTLKQLWMIRRTKAGEIGDKLPAKSDQVIFCGLSAFQREVFRFLLALPQVKAVFTSLEMCPCGKKRPRHKCCEKPEEGKANPQLMLLQLIHVFLKAANHAALLLPQNTSSAVQAELGQEICRGCVRQFPELEDYNFLNLSNLRYSGKMEVLAGLLSVLESERSKVLLFSYSTSLLTILETFIESKGYSYCRLDGNTRIGARQEMVNKFNNDPGTFLFLLSTKAGGLGLNITGANTVIIFDPNWNPSHDMQAQDRAYRLGQTRDVKVFRLISAGCIEEMVYLRQVYKQQQAANCMDDCKAKRLFKGVQGDKNRKGEIFGIENLFKLTSSVKRSCLTEDIEKRHSNIENKILKKSKALTVESYELSDHDTGTEKMSADPFQIGLEEDLDLTLRGDGGGGVVYSHRNDQLVGGSKEEEIISKLAMRSAGTTDGSKIANEINYDLVLPDEYCDEGPGDLVHPSRRLDGNNETTPVQKKEKYLENLGSELGLDKKETERRILEMSMSERLDMIRMMTKAGKKSEVREVKEKGYKSSSNPLEQSNREIREGRDKTGVPCGEKTRSAQKRLLISVDEANSSPQKSLEPSGFSSEYYQSSKQRPLKPAPEGIYFKKRKREFERNDIKNYDEGEDKYVLKQSAAKSELDEMFPESKFEVPESKLKLSYSSKSQVTKKKYEIVEETLEDIFG